MKHLPIYAPGYSTLFHESGPTLKDTLEIPVYTSIKKPEQEQVLTIANFQVRPERDPAKEKAKLIQAVLAHIKQCQEENPKADIVSHMQAHYPELSEHDILILIDFLHTFKVE